MLVNQLDSLSRLILEGFNNSDDAISGEALDSEVAKVAKAWEVAAFSDLPEHTLRRYFNHQLEGITDISDTLFLKRPLAKVLQWHLLKQIDHLVQYYATYLNWDASAPKAYQRRLAEQLMTSIHSIRKSLNAEELPVDLRRCLQQWLDQVTDFGASSRYTFRSLNYFETIISRLATFDFQAGNAETALIALLSHLNFNHLAFLAFRQNKFSSEIRLIGTTADQLAFLQEQRAVVLAGPEANELTYDSTFPSLKTMLGAWLQEQIVLAEIALKKENDTHVNCRPEKQPLDLSVAHLACLIKLFLEENIFLSRNTKGIFQFFAANYQTRRQTVISAGSLSKEFYSIDQHTAARVRDLLQKMIARINRNFFPVMAVISTAILAHPGTH